MYPKPDPSNNRKLVFYDLLRRSESFAILSAKKMPKVSCDDMTAYIQVLFFSQQFKFWSFFVGVGWGVSHHVVVIYSNVSKEHTASIFRVTESSSSGCWSSWRQ